MTKFIAEISSNHNRSLERCLRFVDAASEIGCDAVKFQLFRIDELFAPAVLRKKKELRERAAWELPLEFVAPIAAHCRQRGLQFACTPFYLEAVPFLLPYVDFYKISSYELTWPALLETCARTGKPVILSTGMATLDEIRGGVDLLRKAGCRNLTLLHCISGYPTPVSECNLSAIETLRSELQSDSSEFQLHLGWSDHSTHAGVIQRAVHRWGASVIEFHLDLEGEGYEFGAGHCWLPDRIREVIRSVREGESADGDGKKVPADSERMDRDWRADPSDGLRPILKIRQEWENKKVDAV